MIDFQEQFYQAERQRKLAEALRAAGQEAPQGQMISGHYVAPSIFQQLAPLANTLGGVFAGRRADEQMGKYRADVGAAKANWMNTVPQAIPASAEKMGPPDPNNPTALDAQPAQPVTSAQFLKHAMSGLNIPDNKGAAELYSKVYGDELTREDKQAEGREKLRLEQILKREQFEKDERLAAQRSAEHNQYLMLIKTGQLEAAEGRREAAADRRGAAADRRGASAVASTGRLTAAVEKEQAKADAKSLDLRKDIRDKIEKSQSAASVMDTMASTFKPGYSGIKAKAQILAADNVWGVTNEPGTWWKNYRKNVQVVERHAITGANLTIREGGIWKAADINEDMPDDVVAKNLEIRKTLLRMGYIRNLQNTERSGKAAHKIYNEDPTALDAELRQLEAKVDQLHNAKLGQGNAPRPAPAPEMQGTRPRAPSPYNSGKVGNDTRPTPPRSGVVDDWNLVK